jgi:hypothetical protein
MGIHYYAPIQDHELVTRRDLISSEPDHPRAGAWYYKLKLGPLEHKLPPIVAHRWRRVTFIVTTGDRFMNALEINDLFEHESPVGQLYVRLKKVGIPVERSGGSMKKGSPTWWTLALPVGEHWLTVTLVERLGPDGDLRFRAGVEADTCPRLIQKQSCHCR